MARASEKPVLTAEQWDSFWKTIIKTDGCWLPSVKPHSNGYCEVMRKVQGKHRHLRVHRLTWLFVTGAWPEVLDHLCRNKACCNPAHLEDVTIRENTLRGIGPTAVNARKTHCERGHELSGRNLMIYPQGRYCRACQHQRKRDVSVLSTLKAVGETK